MTRENHTASNSDARKKDAEQPAVKVGDRVRVVLEGWAEDIGDGLLRIQDDHRELSYVYGPGDRLVKSIEVLPPPVEVFGLGDVLRSLTEGAGIKATHALGVDGYLHLWTGEFYTYGKTGYGAWWFTSERFERVVIEEQRSAAHRGNLRDEEAVR